MAFCIFTNILYKLYKYHISTLPFTLNLMFITYTLQLNINFIFYTYKSPNALYRIR